jgi:hypothetical protein
VVHYNDTLAAVEVALQHQFGGDGWMDLYKLGGPGLADFARGLGADAIEVSGSGFKPAFSAALVGARQRRKPQVVVVRG